MAKNFKSALELQMQSTDQSVGIAKALPDLMKMDTSLSPSSIDAEMFRKMREGLGSKDRPKHGIYALLDGLFLGAEMGSKKKLQAEMAEKYKGYKAMVDNIVTTKESSDKVIAEKAKEEQVLGVTGKYAQSIFEVANSGLPQQAIDEEGRKIYENLKSVVPELKGTQFLSSPAGKHIFNILDQEGEPRVYRYSELMTPTAWDDIMKRNVDEISANARTMTAEASMKRANIDEAYAETNAAARKTNSDYQNFLMNPVEFAKREGIKVRAAENSKKIMEIQENLQNADVALADLTRLQALIKDSVVSGKSAGMLLRGVGSIFGKTEDVDEAKMLLQSSLYELKNIFKGATSDKDISEFMATLPTLEKNPKASLNRLNVLLTRFENKRNLYKKQVEDYNKDVTANLHSDTQNINEKKGNTGDTGAEKGGGNQNGLWMKTPNNTRIWIPSKKVKDAYADGLVEE